MSEIEVVALRRAALALLLISLVRWWAVPRPEVTVGAFASGSTEESLAQLSERTRAAADDADRRSRPLEASERIDPNAADEAELDRLPGVGPSTASAIVSARTAGAVFRSPQDLVQVRGIGPRTAERLEPHLSFDRAGAGSRTRRSAAAREDGSTASGRPSTARTPVDVNRASAEALTALPGIGPALAERIVEARRSGTFGTLQDLTRVRGIGPSTVSRLRGLAVTGRIGR